MAVLCFILGLIPAGIGFVLNWAVRKVNLAGSFWASLVFLLTWGILSYLLGSKCKNTKTVVLGLNAVAIIGVIYVALQEYVLHYSVLGGRVSSFFNYFFMPGNPLSFMFLSNMHRFHYVVLVLIDLVLMVIVSIVGASYGKVKHN